VDHSQCVGCPQARQRLLSDAERLANGQPAARQETGQAHTVDVLHCKKVMPRILSDEMDLYDMRVDQFRSRSRFGPKQTDVFGLVSQLPIQDLDRHPPVKSCLIAQIHLAHPSARNPRDDLKVAELLKGETFV